MTSPASLLATTLENWTKLSDDKEDDDDDDDDEEDDDDDDEVIVVRNATISQTVFGQRSSRKRMEMARKER